MSDVPALLVADAGDGVALLTLDRPRQRNAMSADLVAGLIAALDRAEDDDAVRAIVIAGAGNGFCAGSDLAGLAAADRGGRRRFEADSGRVARMIPLLSKPVVAAAHGFAIGGGLTLAVACDIVVTDAGARWSLPEVPIGLFPAWGLGAVLERVGRATARRLSFGIDTVDGAEAVRLGLADILAMDDVRAEALALARRLAALPRGQAAAVKTYFNTQGLGEEGDRLANALFMAACESPEAVASFARFAKR